MAMLILSVATMAMGASTGHIMGQIHAATLRTERMTAVRETAESLRHADWASLETACADAGSSFGTEHFAVSCSVNLVAGNLKEVLLITTGPGVRAGRIVPSLPDTFGISIANPAD